MIAPEPERGASGNGHEDDPLATESGYDDDKDDDDNEDGEDDTACNVDEAGGSTGRCVTTEGETIALVL